MKIVFRCDSSFTIGSGHLVRCLNLAHLLKGEIIFICRNLSGNINSRVIQNQFKLIELPDIPKYSVEEKIVEIEEVEPYLSSQKPDLIIVDHYGLDEEWEMAAKNWAKKVAAIDDLWRKHHADIILDQNFRASTPRNYIQSKAKLFLGPHYCLLSEVFLSMSPPLRSHFNIQKILVFFGGSDLEGMTLKLLNIAISQFKDINWNIVVGEQNQELSKIKEISKNQPNIELHINTTEMAELMKQSDLFVGAGGTTSWERAKLGLPSIVISIAKNQEQVCEELKRIGVIIYLGSSSSVTEKKILKEIKKLISFKDKRKLLSQSSIKLEVSSKINEFIKAINFS